MGTNPQYVFKEAQTVQSTDLFPVLDLGPFLNGEPDALPALAKEVCQAHPRRDPFKISVCRVEIRLTL